VAQPTKIQKNPDMPNWPALLTVFALVIGFTYSDDAIEFVSDITGSPYRPVGPWLVFALDLLFVIVTAVLKRMIDGGPADLRTFLRGLVTGWWGLGAVLVIGAHLALIASSGRRSNLDDTATVWISLLASSVFVAAMTALLVSTLGGGQASRSWLFPLIVGTFIAHLASALWYPVINIKTGCANDISPIYFSDMANILAVLLLAVGVELNFIRRNSASRDLGRRMAPLFTVAMLCVALPLSFSVLVKADLGPLCGIGAVWHEYIAFVITAQAMATGLATLVWLLVIDAVKG
jgi:hypothetical protein